MANVKVIELRWPIVVVRWPDAVEPSDIRDLFVEYKRCCDRASQEGVKLGWLVDFSQFNPVRAPASLRKVMNDQFDEHKQYLVPTTAAEARVVHDKMARAIITAFDWVSTKAWPTKNFGDEEEAVEWLRRECLFS